MILKYRVKGQTSFVFWDKDCVVYHHQSGNTHLMIDVPEVLLMRCLSDKPYTSDDLYEVAHKCPEFEGQGLSEYLNYLLNILTKKDLIEQLN